MPWPAVATSVYYSDAACTDLVAIGTLGCAPSVPYAYTTEQAPACGATRYAFRQLGSEVSATAIWNLSSGGCAGPNDLSASITAYSVGAVVPPSQFVQMTESVE